MKLLGLRFLNLEVTQSVSIPVQSFPLSFACDATQIFVWTGESVVTMATVASVVTVSSVASFVTVVGVVTVSSVGSFVTVVSVVTEVGVVWTPELS